MALEVPRNVFDIWFSPFTNFLRSWDYKPVTSWFEHFITINWNSNDADVEQHVLGEVGSYGLQLSRILDAVDLLVSELDLARLTPEQQRIVVRLEDLRDAAHRAVNEYRGRTEPEAGVGRRRDAPAGHRRQLVALASLGADLLEYEHLFVLPHCCPGRADDGWGSDR